jgi:hypothetical protein
VTDSALEQRPQHGPLSGLLQKPEGVKIVDNRERFADAAEARQNHRRREIASLEQVP